MKTSTTAESYAGVMAERVASERVSLAASWLARLKDVVGVEPNEVFPSEQLLDHIPVLVAEIAGYVGAPAEEAIVANAAVIDKARELGLLRHEQRASVHQLLHEYEILGEIMERFVVDETTRLGLQPPPRECFDVLLRLTHAVRVLMRTTVDTFVSEYTTTIQERNERIEGFNRAASHELRTPLGTILFAAGVLEKDAVREEPERVHRIATTVRTNAERMLHLLDNLQRIARLSEPIDVPSQQRVETGALALEVARQLDDMASARKVAIRVAEDLPALCGDPAHIELVLLNLVSNAVKYSDPQKTDSHVDILSAEGASLSHSASTCTICVRDNGLGIPDADQSTVFDRFVRAHAHLDQELGISGTGLGLAIVAECVEALNGSIRCESAVGRGTAFYVTLPCEPAGSS